jgi:hypothetical protein
MDVLSVLPGSRPAVDAGLRKVSHFVIQSALVTAAFDFPVYLSNGENVIVTSLQC